MKSKSLNYGKVVLGLFPFKNRTSIKGIEDKIISKIKSDITKYDSPFIIIKFFSNKKNINESSLKQISTQLNIDVALIGEITEPTKETGKLKKLKADCYETYIKKIPAKTVKTESGSTTTPAKEIKKGKKTYWYYHTRKRVLEHKVSFNMINTNNNKVLYSGYTYAHGKSNIEYGTYPGDKPWNLEPYDPEAKVGTVLLGSYRAIKSIGDEDYIPYVEAKYFRASKELRTYNEISYSFPSVISEKITKNICPILDSKE